MQGLNARRFTVSASSSSSIRLPSARDPDIAEGQPLRQFLRVQPLTDRPLSPPSDQLPETHHVNAQPPFKDRKWTYRSILRKTLSSIILALTAFTFISSFQHYWLLIQSMPSNDSNRPLHICFAQNIGCTLQQFLTPSSSCQHFPCDVLNYRRHDAATALPTLDCALAANGGSILPGFTSRTLGYEEANLGLFDYFHYFFRGYYPQYARIVPAPIVIDSHVQAGRCWAFRGSAGHIGISLSQPILVTGITFHHPDHRELAPELLAQAPSTVRLWSLQTDTQGAGIDAIDVNTNSHVSAKRFSLDVANREPGSFALLATLSYDPTSPGQRVFYPVTGPRYISSIVVLEVTENWGGDRTCLYRISIHGVPAER
ncbi:hypothetical protein PM082_022729 [Marasmius tenuissimus]|nr:hypothetical protein PM082_022729 [Marasmius tenuissimus]